ncbi:hypothetical protein V8C42DRAFT_325138 [Trichoderma barbatum]
MEEQRLPSHHQLFAALIPPSSLLGLRSTGDFSGNPGAADQTRDTPSSAQDANWRQQLLTLHVIFPSLLLPALDLLDRGLVTRLIVADKQNARGGAEVVAAPPNDILEDKETADTVDQPESRIPNSRQAIDCKDQICIYTVQSAASTTSRRKRHAPKPAKVYAVHLDAWGCSCGGFAIDAYSNYDATNTSENLQSSTPPKWFGTLELDRRLASQEDFTCCKHLLACLLAEKWRTTPGGHVQDNYTTKEELAAIIGGP